MGPFGGAGYNLPLCRLQSRLQHIYHGQPYARVDLNPILSQFNSPVRDVGFGLGACYYLYFIPVSVRVV
jgi:hypothetical protein